MKNANDLMQTFKRHKFMYNSNFAAWKLKSTKDIIKQNYGNCYDTSYIARKVIPDAKILFIANLTRKLNDRDRQMLSKGKIPNITNVHSDIHTFAIFPYKNNYYWFEYSFEKQRGIHKYKSLESLINSFLRIWKKETSYKHYMLTQLSNVKIGMNIEQFTDRGFLSKILQYN